METVSHGGPHLSASHLSLSSFSFPRALLACLSRRRWFLPPPELSSSPRSPPLELFSSPRSPRHPSSGGSLPFFFFPGQNRADRAAPARRQNSVATLHLRSIPLIHGTITFLSPSMTKPLAQPSTTSTRIADLWIPIAAGHPSSARHRTPSYGELASPLGEQARLAAGTSRRRLRGPP